MSTYIDTMRAPPAELAKRLDRLYGDEGAASCEDLSELAAQLRELPRFDEALAQARALADPNRLLALALLKRKSSLCACELQAALGVNHATVSHHMRLLAGAGLVASEQRGKWVHYSLAERGAIKVP